MENSKLINNKKNMKKEESISDVMKSLNTKYGSGTIAKTADFERAEIKFIPTNSFSLDHVFGGGLPSGRIIEIFGVESCQPAGSKVLMSDGQWKNIEDICIGDMIISPQRDGSTQHSRVLHTTSWDCPETFSVNKKYGDKEEKLYSCSFNHVVPFYRSGNVRIGERKDEKSVYLKDKLNQMTAKELSCDKLFDGIASKKTACFSTSRIESFLGRKDPDVGPYSLGMLLANGSLSKESNTVLSSNVRLGRAVARRMMKEGVLFTNGEGIVYKNREGCITARLKKNQSISSWLKKENLLGKHAHDKFIPDSALYASAEFRTRLLAGLLEGDGYFDPSSVTFPRWEYASVSKRLAENFVILVFSLGGKATITPRTTMCNGKEFPSFRVYLTMPYGIEMANTKKEGLRLGKKERASVFHSRYPLSVRPEGKAKVYGMTISSSSQWYVTDNWMVTHNSGKSTLALYLISQIQKLKKKTVLIDVEYAYSQSYSKNIGVDVDNLIVSQPSNGEEAFDIIENVIKTGDVGLIVIDSVAALLPVSEQEKEVKDVTIALQARLLSRGLRRITGIAAKTGTTILFINQIRDRINVSWGPRSCTSGGRALRFYSSVRIEVKKGKKIKDKKENVIGNWLDLCSVKNKVSSPFREASMELIFNKGIDQEGDLIDNAEKHKIISRAGMVYTFGNEHLGNGRDKVKELLVNDKKLFDKIKKELDKKLST